MEHGSAATELYYVNYFISHIVQMELRILPHSPDVLQPLYPTLFRWNLTNSLPSATTLFSFISHIVQMERIFCDISSESPDSLYIPHCSDGTALEQQERLQQIKFISHIVQMERCHRVPTSKLLYVYIPHCSDGTVKPPPK